MQNKYKGIPENCSATLRFLMRSFCRACKPSETHNSELCIDKFRCRRKIRHHKIEVQNHQQQIITKHPKDKNQSRMFFNFPDRTDKCFHLPSTILSFRDERGLQKNILYTPDRKNRPLLLHTLRPRLSPSHNIPVLPPSENR